MAGDIPSRDVSKHASYDAHGYVFSWRGEIYRAIRPTSENLVRRLFEIGLIDQLVREKLVPDTSITGYRTTDCNLVLWHKTIPVVTLPSEWSFTMLKRAALTVIKVNSIARRFGYQTTDAHGFNILFQAERPMYIDIGSFGEINRELDDRQPGWRAYGEFMRSFFAPLKLWAAGDVYFARQCLYGVQVPMASYWVHRWRILKLLPVSLLRSLEELYFGYKALNTLTLDEFWRHASKSYRREKAARVLHWLSKRHLMVGASVNLHTLARRVQGLSRPKTFSTWAQYQLRSTLDERFKYVLAVVNRIKPQTLLDMAGNIGFLSKLIEERTTVRQVICADFDEEAIDELYRSLNVGEHRIHPVVLDFRKTISDTKFRDATQRLRSEMVIALAVTHHWILSQGMTIEFVMDRLALFSSKYVLTEFMPIGLYSSEIGKKPDVPTWYNREWFRKGFKDRFELLDEQELAPNRIAFLGAKRV